MDFDPEEIETAGGGDHSDSQQSDEQNNAYTGREHYEEVGKSKLHKPAGPKLGAQYVGSSVSRSALNRDASELDPLAPVDDSSDENPFAKPEVGESSSGDESIDRADEALPTVVEGEVDEDKEIDSDEAFGDDDEERFKEYKFSGSKNSRVVGEEIKSGRPADETNNEDEDEDMEDVDGTDSDDLDDKDQEGMESVESSEDLDASENDSDSTTSTTPEVPTSAPSSNREALKAILANDTAAVASTLSAAAQSDAKKGRAVKQQHQTFDRILDARIKLQKGMTAINALPSDQITDSEHREACLKAEEAALTLWSTISSIRHSLLPHSQPSQKRKRPTPATTSTLTSELWTQTTALETQSLPQRRSTLDKWAVKARPASTLPPAKSTLIDRTSQSASITSVLDAHLASLPPPSPQPYDDSLFYQSLLRSLIASRSSASSNNISTTVLPSTLHPSGSKSKHVNTKASKGRKVRYTVHEKLQNFAAEEQRGTWSEAASREFFGSLFGGKGALREDEEDEVEGGDREGEALRLFSR